MGVGGGVFFIITHVVLLVCRGKNYTQILESPEQPKPMTTWFSGLFRLDSVAKHQLG